MGSGGLCISHATVVLKFLEKDTVPANDTRMMDSFRSFKNHFRLVQFPVQNFLVGVLISVFLFFLIYRTE